MLTKYTTTIEEIEEELLADWLENRIIPYQKALAIWDSGHGDAVKAARIFDEISIPDVIEYFNSPEDERIAPVDKALADAGITRESFTQNADSIFTAAIKKLLGTILQSGHDPDGQDVSMRIARSFAGSVSPEAAEAAALAEKIGHFTEYLDKKRSANREGHSSFRKAVEIRPSLGEPMPLR